MPGKSYLTKLINCEASITQQLLIPAVIHAGISVDVLRLDLIHPVISGNKFFKLLYPVAKAIDTSAPGIISFGGAYSNHLVALACLCAESGLPFIGVIRGEEPKTLSATLHDAIGYKMHPVFVSLSLYADKEQLVQFCLQQYPGYMVIPEGGQSPEGVRGAAEILDLTERSNYDLIACAVGTGTMLAGLLHAALPQQSVIGISALKTMAGNDIEAFVRNQCPGKPFTINYEYHFGGYAKRTPELISFMNYLWHQSKIPTDFVYTAKLLYAVCDLAEKKYFAKGSRILAIHSGGLQGNRSLANELDFG